MTMTRILLSGLLVLLGVGGVRADDSARAAETRKKLKQKVTVDYKEERLEDVLDDLKDKVKGISFRLDSKGGVSKNRKLTYKASNKPLEDVLDEMFKKEELGYIIISKDKDAYDGGILIKVGKERGTPQGEEKK